MGYSIAGGKLIDEKNQKRKISWHCPFKCNIYAYFIANVEENLILFVFILFELFVLINKLLSIKCLSLHHWTHCGESP